MSLILNVETDEPNSERALGQHAHPSRASSFCVGGTPTPMCPHDPPRRLSGKRLYLFLDAMLGHCSARGVAQPTAAQLMRGGA